MNDHLISRILLDRSQQLFKDLLKALSLILDMALGHKQQHSLRVAITSVQTAAKLGLSAEVLRDVFYAGLLHDLGEICLDESERLELMRLSDQGTVPEMLRRHPTVGAQICSRIPTLAGAAVLIAQHMERLDGSGYPVGLRGSQLSSAAQVLGLVNELDELVFLTSPRLDMDPARRQREVAWRWRGRKVTEEVADAYLEVQKEGAWSVTAFADRHWRELKLDVLDLARLIDVPADAFVESILRVFASVIDAKHAYTHGHSWRTAAYGRLLAQHLRLPDDKIKLIYHAGLLHDAGKVGVPGTILDNPGKLTEEEWNVIREHPRKTRIILQAITGLEELADVAGYHHERYDGRGYFKGLAGDEIPYGSRVLSVADTYDAMCSDRAYRKALPHRVAVEEIQRWSGKMYDPEIVRRFLSIAEAELEEIRHGSPEDLERLGSWSG
ncbi:MAG: HD domain-containing phosphohydrolase [Candidatus Sericytochromatia bacterium]|nr:HD domain-containing phosphohydrolase [Candidatus Sericytochromatia bacterium]